MDMTINEKGPVNQFGPFEKLKILVVTKVAYFLYYLLICPTCTSFPKTRVIFFLLDPNLPFPKPNLEN
jgi:hypothetical protein